MHICFLMFLLLFPLCNLTITPHSSKQYDAPFYYSNESKSNHFFIYAEYVTSSSNPITYSKYNIKFNPSTTLTASSVDDCTPSTSSDLSEIFSSKTSALTINLHSILSTEYIYYVKVGICSSSTSDITISINSLSAPLSCKLLPPSYVILTIQKQTGTNNIIISCGGASNTINSIEIPISDNYEIETDKGITNYILTAQILSKKKTFTRNGDSSCNKEGDNKCLEGYFCNENTCSKCHELCSECYASHLNSCTQCKIIDDDDEHLTNTECEVNYIDMTQLGDIEIDITPPKTHRVTLGVWVFVPYVN